MFRKLIFIAMLAGVSSARVTHAQQPGHIVRGQVLDAQTGESLPSANIRIEGTFRGTITNADGAFEIAIEEHNYPPNLCSGTSATNRRSCKTIVPTHRKPQILALSFYEDITTPQVGLFVKSFQ